MTPNVDNFETINMGPTKVAILCKCFSYLRAIGTPISTMFKAPYWSYSIFELEIILDQLRNSLHEDLSYRNSLNK